MQPQARKFLSAIFFLLLCISVSIGHAQTPQQILTQYVADLQKSPNDYALREKIIRHVQTMKPAPAVPDEAKRYLSRGIAAMKEAKSKDEFSDAAKEFEKATLSAPWFANAYYNLGVAQDKAGAYANAIRSLKLYLLASPDAKDAEAVKGLIYEIEYRQEKAAKESSPQAMAEKQQNKADEVLKRINGVRYVRPMQDSCSRYSLFVNIRGEEFEYGIIVHWQSRRDCNDGVPVGKPWVYGGGRIVSKRMQGDNLILETNGMLKTITVKSDTETIDACDVGGCAGFRRAQ